MQKNGSFVGEEMGTKYEEEETVREEQSVK